MFIMDELLIEKVRKHEALYNPNCRDYRDKYVRQESWEVIGRELQISATEGKEAWDKLRKCYVNAISRRRAIKSSQAARKMTPWKFESEMSFILPFVETRKTHTNLQQIDEPNPDISQDSSEEMFQEQMTPSTENIEICPIISNFNSDGEQGDEILEAEVTDYPNNIPEIAFSKNLVELKKKRKIISEAASRSLQLAQNEETRNKKYIKRKALAPVKSISINDFDESDLFFLSMSKTAKRLPPLVQAKIKLEISNTVLQAEIYHAEKTTCLGSVADTSHCKPHNKVADDFITSNSQESQANQTSQYNNTSKNSSSPKLESSNFTVLSPEVNNPE